MVAATIQPSGMGPGRVPRVAAALPAGRVGTHLFQLFAFVHCRPPCFARRADRRGSVPHARSPGSSRSRGLDSGPLGDYGAGARVAVFGAPPPKTRISWNRWSMTTPLPPDPSPYFASALSKLSDKPICHPLPKINNAISLLDGISNFPLVSPILVSAVNVPSPARAMMFPRW